MRLWPKRRIGHLIRAGDAAAGVGDWANAAEIYLAILERAPDHVAIWIQYGHALRQLARHAEARDAYEYAVGLNPDDGDAQLQLARALETLGERDAAEDHYVAALRANPGIWDAYRALILSGARDRIPAGLRQARKAFLSEQITAQIAESRRLAEQLAEMSTEPLKNYQSYRERPTEPPPSRSGTGIVKVILDARGRLPVFIQSSLFSLFSQSRESWTATIIADDALLGHTVTTVAEADARVRIACSVDLELAGSADDLFVHLSAGTRLDRQALDWLAFAAGVTGAMAAYPDHDRGVDHWREGCRYEVPTLFGAFDPDWLAATRWVPAVVATRDAAVLRLSERFRHDELRRAILLQVGETAPVAHLPLILAMVLRLPDRAMAAPPLEGEGTSWSLSPNGSQPDQTIPQHGDRVLMQRDERPVLTMSPVRHPDEKIHIIVQTRDGGAMLTAALDSMIDRAAVPDRLLVTIVDNGSRQAETRTVLERLRNRGCEILLLDTAFNWSNANNVAADTERSAQATQLLFVNDDIEMLTDGWDDLLLGYLQRDDVGIVGVRMLYPDRTIQHAGVLPGTGMGADKGTFIHDGLRCDAYDSGPLDRFDVTRRAAAVTGAFMGIQRARFLDLGGFDARHLPVAYNDIDLCFHVRAAGLQVLYAPAIEIIHHESKTRGVNRSRAQVAWDLGELSCLYRRWGEQMLVDPSVNPQWSSSRPFDGLLRPTRERIIEHLISSGRQNPWQLEPPAARDP